MRLLEGAAALESSVTFTFNVRVMLAPKVRAFKQASAPRQVCRNAQFGLRYIQRASSRLKQYAVAQSDDYQGQADISEILRDI